MGVQHCGPALQKEMLFITAKTMKKYIYTIKNNLILCKVGTPVMIKIPYHVPGPSEKEAVKYVLFVTLKKQPIYQEKEATQISQHKYRHPGFLLDYPNLKWKLL